MTVFRPLLHALALLCFASAGLAAKVFSAQQLEKIQTVLVIPVEWKPSFKAVYQGVTVFGNRNVALPQDFATHACVARGVAEARAGHPRFEIEVMPLETVKAYQSRIDKLGSGLLAYAKKFMQLVPAEHPADLYVLVLTWPGGASYAPAGWGSHGFLAMKGPFSGKPGVSAFWSASFMTFDVTGKYQKHGLNSRSVAHTVTTADGDAFVRLLNEDAGPLRSTLRALIAGESRDLLGALLSGQKQPPRRVIEDLAPVEDC